MIPCSSAAWQHSHPLPTHVLGFLPRDCVGSLTLPLTDFFYWVRAAGASLLELEPLDIAFACDVAILRCPSQGLCQEQGSNQGQRGWGSHPASTGAHRGSCASPATLAALLCKCYTAPCAVIYLQISPWRASFDQCHLPSSYVFLKLKEKKVGVMQGASCPPCPSSPGL